ncbi:MAG: magnesium transporter [Planctomycetota bacterium]|jgi:magnesium transporter
MAEEALKDEIYQLIEAKDFTSLKQAVSEMEIHDLADLLGELEDEALAVVFRLLPQAPAAEAFGALELEQQEKLISVLSSERVAAIVNDMPPDDRTELLEELPGEIAQRLLNSLRGNELRIARSLLAYPEESIGRLMTPEYVAVRPDRTVQQVLDHVRKVAPTKETLYVVYVVDDSGQLLDEIPLERVILAEPAETVSALMDETVASLNASDDQETAVDLFKKYDAVALPVVNNQGILVGIVTFDDVMDVAEEEGTEDFQKMAGMGALEYSYFGTGFWAMLRKRLPWLMLLLFAQMLTTLALTNYHALALFPLLVIFVPLINSPAGNTGSQTAGLMIRGLAVQEIALGDWYRILGRELLRGAALGLVLAAVGYAAAYVFAPMVGAALGGLQLPSVAMSVALAIAAAVTLANIVGSMLPFIFKRVGFDPAVTSGPFIASLMDVSGIVIYFSIATALLAIALG